MVDVTLLKIAAVWVTQKSTHGPLLVDSKLLVSGEQTRILSWAGWSPYGTGPEAVRAPLSGCTRGGAVPGSVPCVGWMCLRKQQMGFF